MIKLGMYLLFFGIIAFQAMADSSIIIRPVSEVPNKKLVTLNDIAVFNSVEDPLRKKLEKIVLSDAPNPGEKRVYPKQAVLLALNANHADVLKKNNIKIKVPMYATVATKGKALNKETVMKILEKDWKRGCSDCRFRFASMSLPMIPVATPIVDWHLEPSTKVPRGQFAAKINVLFKTGVESRFWVTGQVKLYKKVPVFNRSLQMGERMTPKDVEWKEKEITYSYDSIPELSMVFGKQLKRTVNHSDVIYQKLFKREKALQRGQMVKVISNTGTWEVSISGIAQQDGFEGDIINVRNSTTKKLISGVVTGKGEVTIR